MSKQCSHAKYKEMWWVNNIHMQSMQSFYTFDCTGSFYTVLIIHCKSEVCFTHKNCTNWHEQTVSWHTIFSLSPFWLSTLAVLLAHKNIMSQSCTLYIYYIFKSIAHWQDGERQEWAWLVASPQYLRRWSSYYHRHLGGELQLLALLSELVMLMEG